MIDIENVVYTKVRQAIKSKYPDARVESIYVNAPPSFPCVCFVEKNNSVYSKTQGLEGKENHANLLYECNIYTEGKARKQQAKSIAQMVDTAMSEMRFTRTFSNPTPNIERTIYRYTLRFEGIADKGVKDGKNTVFHIYQK